MSSRIARGYLVLASLFSVFAIYLGTYFVAKRQPGVSDTLALLITSAVSAPFFGIAWLLIWRTEITWTTKRRMLTFVSAFLSVGIAIVYGTILSKLSRFYGLREAAIVLSGLLWLGIWMAATVTVWRESPAERASRRAAGVKGRLHCPECRYSMAGLHEARCPECGKQYLLEELFALLVEGDAAEREAVE